MADSRHVNDKFPLVCDLTSPVDFTRIPEVADLTAVRDCVGADPDALKAYVLAAKASAPARPDWLPDDWKCLCCPATLEIEAVRQWFEFEIMGLEESERWLEEEYTDDDRRNPNSVFHCAGNDDYRDAFILVEVLRKGGMDNLPYRERGNFSASDAAEELRKLRDLICAEAKAAPPAARTRRNRRDAIRATADALSISEDPQALHELRHPQRLRLLENYPW